MHVAALHVQQSRAVLFRHTYVADCSKACPLPLRPQIWQSKISNAIIGLRSRIDSGCHIEDAMVIGADYYETEEERKDLMEHGETIWLCCMRVLTVLAWLSYCIVCQCYEPVFFRTYRVILKPSQPSGALMNAGVCTWRRRRADRCRCRHRPEQRDCRQECPHRQELPHHQQGRHPGNARAMANIHVAYMLIILTYVYYTMQTTCKA